MVLGGAWALCAVLQFFLWRLQKQRGEADIVDVGWAGSLGALAALYALLLDGDIIGRLCVAVFGVAWSVRLGSYLFRQRFQVPGEDERYHSLRLAWGENAQRNFFLLFQAQALLAVILSLPFLAICMSREVPSSGALIGAILLFIGSIAGEAWADSDLHAFRSDPNNRGKVCRTGLWSYSRHPNYFFEWLYWWSYVALGLQLPSGWLTLIGPAVMYYFLRYLTGIPATEARALESRGEEYRRYQTTTNAFFPWFPRHEVRK